jgi:hypothetical protein
LLVGESVSECRYGRHINCDVLRKRIGGDNTQTVTFRHYLCRP